MHFLGRLISYRKRLLFRHKPAPECKICLVIGGDQFCPVSFITDLFGMKVRGSLHFSRQIIQFFLPFQRAVIPDKAVPEARIFPAFFKDSVHPVSSPHDKPDKRHVLGNPFNFDFIRKPPFFILLQDLFLQQLPDQRTFLQILPDCIHFFMGKRRKMPLFQFFHVQFVITSHITFFILHIFSVITCQIS